MVRTKTKIVHKSRYGTITIRHIDPNKFKQKVKRKRRRYSLVQKLLVLQLMKELKNVSIKKISEAV